MVKIEKITRGQITISYKGQYYNILGEGLLLTEGNAYSYIIYRNSIDNTLSPIEQETILQAIIEHFWSKGQKVIIEYFVSQLLIFKDEPSFRKLLFRRFGLESVCKSL